MFLSDIQYFLFVIRSCGQQIGQGWQLLEVSLGFLTSQSKARLLL